MFTGIIEEFGIIQSLEQEGSNLHLWIEAPMTSQLKIDQSVAHNGICLTVVEISENKYKVTAIKETIDKTTIGLWKEGDKVNLERGMKLDARLDGHIVQGHVDQTAICSDIKKADGSTYFTFSYDENLGNVTIEKGSITVDGTSLTVVNSQKNSFSVAIIPYTMEHTQFHRYQIGDPVNLEFDVIGKYVKRLIGSY
ncbi:riboflavin synthase [Capnocytophaga sp. ARDL2]|uniref:riboflavin synthase n=1 Tax=Capnocytophaga sp. ARDL2 TaxID=3238809 RepID=UPI00355834C2